MGINIIFATIFLMATIFNIINAEPTQDKQALIDFVQAVSLTPPLDWRENSSPCTNWTGVTCNQEKSRIISLQISGFHFRNNIQENTLGRLTALQILNVSSNSIPGPLPFDFSNLENLTAIYLESNNLSGPLPFFISNNLSIIDLSNNAFNGTIPLWLSNLTRLVSLNLANNSFSGQIPHFNFVNLQALDLSNNKLTGNIPMSLRKFPNWAFSGNHLANPSKKSKKTNKSVKLGVIIGGCALVSMAVVILLVVFYSKKVYVNEKSAYSRNKKEGFMKKERAAKENGNENGKLVFSKGCDFVFDLEDLLRASAEVLGKGSFGTTYKAALEDTSTVVVKRVKEERVSQREFEEMMGLVGSIRHENVVDLRAYYYSKEEKLMLYDYYITGSAYAMLYAKRGKDRVPLDWETRLKIAIGASRGIAHIHDLKLIHGNIKSSNIFLNSQGYGSISDLGIATIISPTVPPSVRTNGYVAPEAIDTRKAIQPSDVYSFGVLLLELLTGKSPEHDAVHLVRWVNSVVREEWTAEVFDVELMRYPNIEEEMVEMLQIGLACAARVPEQRPTMTDVMKRVADIRQVASENPSSSESISERSTPGPN